MARTPSFVREKNTNPVPVSRGESMAVLRAYSLTHERGVRATRGVPRNGSHLGIGRKIVAFSANEASPALSLILYCTFNCFGVFGAGSPPKLSL